MAGDLPEIGAKIELDLSDFTKDMNKAISAAGKIDAALDNVVSSANAAEKKLSGIDVKIAVDADTSKLDAIDSDLKSIQSGIKIDIDADTAKVETSLKSLMGKTPNFKIDATYDDAKVKTAKADIDEIDASSATADVKVKESGSDNVQKALDGINTQLKLITGIHVIEIGMGLVSGLENIPILGQLLELDRATTGFETAADSIYGFNISAKQLAEAEPIMKRIFTSNWGDSIEDVSTRMGEVILKTRDFASLESDTTSVFQTAAATGEDFTAVLRSMNTMVGAGLAKNFQEAGDLITFGFKANANQAEDFLDTIDEYSVHLAAAGISMGSFIDMTSQGFDMGARDADKLADAIKEISGIKLTEALSAGLRGEENELFDVLDAVGQVDEATLWDKGEMSGEQFLGGFLGALQAKIAEDESFAGMLQPILGSQVEDMTLGGFLSIDPLATVVKPEDYEGMAKNVTDIMFSDLGSQIEQALRASKTELSTAFSDALDIPGIIEQISTGLATFTSTLAETGDFAVSIEAGLGMEGFADTFHRIESILANMLIGILEVVANLQGDEAGAATRAEVTRLQTGQLEFDLSVATEMGDIETAIMTALRRGVSFADLKTMLGDEINASIESGDLQRAQMLQDAGQLDLEILNIPEVRAQLQEELGGGVGGDIMIRAQQALGNLQDSIKLGDLIDLSETGAAVDTAIKTDEAAAEMLELQTQTKATRDELIFLEEQGGTIGSGIKTGVDAAEQSVSGMTTTIQTESGKQKTAIEASAGAFGEWRIRAGAEADLLMIHLNQIEAKITSINTGLGTAIGTAGGAAPFTPDPVAVQNAMHGFASGGSFEGVGRVHSDEIVMASPRGQDIAVLNQSTSDTVLSGLSQLLGGMGISTGGSVMNVTNNITFNTQSRAEDVAGIGSIGNAVRGY